MLRLEANRGVPFCDGLTRRDFLRVGALATGLGLTELGQLQGAHGPAAGDKSCIQLFLVGGPSQLDTWDMKPDAPAEYRGPFRPIRTTVPGVEICEHFPRMARLAQHYAVLRSIHHDEAPIHETGHQLMQTGYLFSGDTEWPHFGAAAGYLQPKGNQTPSWVVLPRTIGNTGVNVGHGQTAGFLGQAHEPFIPSNDLAISQSKGFGLDPARLEGQTTLIEAIDRVERVANRLPEHAFPKGLRQILAPAVRKAFDLDAELDVVRDRYGRNTFGQSCLLARRLVQHGVRLVTVNMFDTVFGQITWDCHANGGDLCSTLGDYRDTLCPMLDRAYAALLQDLVEMGMLDSTLVLCMGEFGRTPKVNCHNGRDHWTGVWSGLLAGGGIRGGQVLGASSERGEEVADRPIHPAEIAATVYKSLGVDLASRLTTPDGREFPLLSAPPIEELF